MDPIFRINNTDPRITYDANWKIVFNSTDQGGYYSLATTPAAQFFFLFRGTSIKFYGRLGGGGGILQFRLDGKNTDVPLNGTNFASGPAPIFSASNLNDTDHQFFVYINTLQRNGTLAVDYFEIENSSGRGFDLLFAGPNATRIPKEAVLVDNFSPDIVFSNPSQWGSADNVQYDKRSLSYTTQAGASLSYSFNGVAIWYYSDVDITHGFFTVSIDGSTPERLNGKNNGGQLTQRMLWSKTNLNPGSHTFTLTHDDVSGTFISLDFFRIVRGEEAPTLPMGTSTATFTTSPTGVQPVTSTNSANIVPFAVGLTFGLLALAIFVLGGLYYLRRQRRRVSIDINAYPTPLYIAPPMIQANQQSRRPRYNERAPQPTLSATLLSSVTMTTADSQLSSSTGVVDLPPGYRGQRAIGELTRADSPKIPPSNV